MTRLGRTKGSGSGRPEDRPMSPHPRKAGWNAAIALAACSMSTAALRDEVTQGEVTGHAAGVRTRCCHL
jgi:hypothetical protein